MAASSPASPLAGRTLALAGAPGALKDQVAACLAALGAHWISLQLDGKTGPQIADLKEESRIAAALGRTAAAVKDADAIIFVGRDLGQGEAMADFIEEGIGSYHFHLKLAKRMRAKAATDLMALAGASAVGEDAALAADMRNGWLRQMTMVAASEGGPLNPPLLANVVYVSGAPPTAASDSLRALLARLLARPQGYVTGTALRLGF